MIVALLGYPGSRKRTLASALGQSLPGLQTLDFGAFQTCLETSGSEAAKAARRGSGSGRLIPDGIFGTLLAEIVLAEREHPWLLVGLPRNLEQMQSLGAQ